MGQQRPAHYESLFKKDLGNDNTFLETMTFDLREVERNLGTSIVQIIVSKKKDDKTKKYVKFQGSDPKYLRKDDRQTRGNRDRDDDSRGSSRNDRSRDRGDRRRSEEV